MARGLSLLSYAVQRLLLAFPMLLILLTVLFIVLRVLPGDPVLALWGGRPPNQATIDRAREALGLDQPIWVQYWNYLSGILQGDLGKSIGTQYRNHLVWDEVARRLPATIELSIGSMGIATTVGVVTGVVAGAKRDSWIDVAIRLWGTVIWVIPIFWLGLIFQLIFAVWLGWLPPHGRWTGSDLPMSATGMYTVDSVIEGNFGHLVKALRHLALPCLTLGLVLSGFFTKTVRANMLQTMRGDFSDAARARGIPERQVVLHHAFRNALVPVVTVLGLQFAILFAGAVLTEKTFSIDGIGTLLLQSITDKDMTMIQGVVVVYAAIIVGISLVVDIIGAMIDPRIRL